MSIVKPYHDFLGLIGIQHGEVLTLYGIVPRFWYGTFPHERQQLDSNVYGRILTQNKIVKLEKEEAERILKKIDAVKGLYPRQGDVVDPNEDNKQLIDNFVPEFDDNSQFDTPELLQKLFHLCNFYQKNKVANESLEIVRNGLPIFLFEEFVEKLEQLTRELRRTYRTVIERVGTVRGRITTRGMVMMVAQPSPIIECEYETFDIQAPLYKVMMSTLDVIRSTQLPSGFNFLEEKFEQICRRGANLRMKMAEIPSLPLAAAIRECTELERRLPRMFRPFGELLSIALQILKREFYRLKLEEEEQKWWHFTAPSSKLWEMLLEKSLELSGEQWKIEPQEDLKGPWHVKSPKKIDLSITNNETGKVTLLDAKYSVAKETPSSEYQYQQFFYAVKWTVERNKPPEKVALLHPAANEQQETTDQYTFSKGFGPDLENYLGANVNFNVWTLPFPQPDIITDSNLIEYMELINPRLKALLEVEKNSNEFS